MYLIELEKNESIQIVDDDAKILEDGKEKDICVVVTNKRLVLLEDGNKKMDSREVLRITRAASYLPDYDKILEVELSFIERIESHDYDKYILKNGNYFYLSSEYIFEFLKEKR